MAAKPDRSRALAKTADSPTEAQIIPQLPASLQGTYHQLHDIRDKLVNHALESYYRIGQIVERDYEKIAEAVQNAGFSRSEIFDCLAEAAGMNSKTLRDCRRFTQTYGEQEYQSLLGKPIFWTHVRCFLSLPTARQRKKYLEQTVKHGWTAEQLAKAIHEKHGNRRQGSGRRPRAPANVGKALSRFQTTGERYLKVVQGVLFGESYDIATEIAQGPPDDLTEEVQDQARAAIEMLETISQDAQDNAKRIRQAMDRFERVFAAREEAEKAKREAEEKQNLRLLPASVPTR